MTDIDVPSPPPVATLPASIVVVPWYDPVVDSIGFEPRSDYVEAFWLSALGPTATWLLRRLAAGLEAFPDGYELDLAETAAALGLSLSHGVNSPFYKALQRCVMFGLAHAVRGGFAVRRVVPPLAMRQVQRLPEHLQRAHAERLAAEKELRAAGAPTTQPATRDETEVVTAPVGS